MSDAEIENKVMGMLRDIWDKGNPYVPLTWTYCTECGLDGMKQRCIGMMCTGESLCAHHFAKRRIEELRRERDAKARQELNRAEERKMFRDLGASVVLQLTNKPPKEWRQPLDVNDFAKL